MNIPTLKPFNKKMMNYLLRALSSWFNVTEGAPRGGKNVINSQIFAMRVEMSSNRIHGVAGVTQSLAQINILDCDGYGVENYFRSEGYNVKYGNYLDRRALFINQGLSDEKIIIFGGGLHAGSAKLWKGLTLGNVYITEANECNEEFILEAERRTRSAEDRCIIHDLNPKNDGHWYYEYLKVHEELQEKKQNYGYNYQQVELFDNAGLSKFAIENVLKMFEVGSLRYNREVLGLRVNLDGLIYDNFCREEHTHSLKINDCYNFRIAIDYGTSNALVYLLFGERDGKHYLLREFYYDGMKRRQLADDEKYRELERFVEGVSVRQIIVDPSALSFITMIRKRGRFKVVGAVNKIEYGIERTRNALSTGNLFIHEDAINTIKEFGLYMWDSGRDGRGRNDAREIPKKENDHAMDALRYYVATVMKEKKDTRMRVIL